MNRSHNDAEDYELVSHPEFCDKRASKEQPHVQTPRISFEFFPAANAGRVVPALGNGAGAGADGAQFVSVTYGAGGTTRKLTHEAWAQSTATMA